MDWIITVLKGLAEGIGASLGLLLFPKFREKAKGVFRKILNIGKIPKYFHPSLSEFKKDSLGDFRIELNPQIQVPISIRIQISGGGFIHSSREIEISEYDFDRIAHILYFMGVEKVVKK